MDDLLFRYNPWWESGETQEDLIDRPAFFELLKRHFTSKQIVFLTGLRRVGKTTLLKMFIRHLIKVEKIKAAHIFYISLDEYAFSKKSILEIVEEYRKVQKLSYEVKVYLFLDEVASKENFAQQLKNLYDSHNVKVYASSSSASVLKNNKPYLTGRSMVIEVMPLDFREYLKFKKIVIRKADQHLVERYFEEYMNTGGIPEYVLNGEIEYLKELVDDIIYKDIAAIYNVKNIQLLKDYFMLLMERAGKAVSINKIAHILNISPDTAKRYLQMFIDTYLIHAIPRYGKTNERLLAPKKIYAADLGIRTLFTGFRDKGSLFENYVYLKIRDQHPGYIYEEGIEIDFMTEKQELYEVKYNGETTDKQEALMKKTKAKKKIVIHNITEFEKLVV
jgi:hypothetical protein